MLVLLVSPDPLVANILRVTLEGDGYTVLHEQELAPALAVLADHEVSLLLLAVDTADAGHLHRCRTVADSTTAPVVLLGRADGTEIKVQARRAGAADYITWPVEPDELLARVEALLRLVARATGHHSYREIAPGVVFDLNRHAVVVRGQHKPLSTIEYKLLRFLVEHPGRVLSREELLNAVWGWDQATGGREVDVYICYLRGKIEENPRTPRHIITVRGIGYQFERRVAERRSSGSIPVAGTPLSADQPRPAGDGSRGAVGDPV